MRSKKNQNLTKKILFTNFVNFVSNNTFNEFKILIIVEYEVF